MTEPRIYHDEVISGIVERLPRPPFAHMSLEVDPATFEAALRPDDITTDAIRLLARGLESAAAERSESYGAIQYFIVAVAPVVEA